MPRPYSEDLRERVIGAVEGGQLAKRQDAVPLTRDYVTEFERALGKTAGGRPRRAA